MIAPEHVQTDQWAAVAASLSVFANIAQSMYARHRGKKKDPIIAAIRKDLHDMGERIEIIESKLDLVLRGRSGPHRLLDDRHPNEEK